jgi:tRNA modification GTPase
LSGVVLFSLFKKGFLALPRCGNMPSMFEQDTICAVSTPSGEGGIGIIRISGKDAIKIASGVFNPRKSKDFNTVKTHSVLYGHIFNPVTGETIDEVLISLMRAPASYTREDVVEIHCHGGMMAVWRIIALLIAAGARQAEPGEFTKRAFLNGRIDLAQAEAVMDIISAKTELSLHAAQEQLGGGLSAEVSTLRDMVASLLASVEAGIDFPEEDIEPAPGKSVSAETAQAIEGVEQLLLSFTYGKILRDGCAVAIIGKPNVGKSSLLNALLKQERAIVTDVPGTTRDVLEEYLNIAGFPVKVIDTAGIRHSKDVVEKEGVRRSLAAVALADIVLVVLDGSHPITVDDQRVLSEAQGKNALVVINKSDLPGKIDRIDSFPRQVSLSCLTGRGLNDLKNAIADIIKQGTVIAREHAWTVNQRHKTALEQVRESLLKAHESIKAGLSPEFVALDLRGALDSLGLIIGTTYTEDILNRIFDNFCIGK